MNKRLQELMGKSPISAEEVAEGVELYKTEILAILQGNGFTLDVLPPCPDEPNLHYEDWMVVEIQPGSAASELIERCNLH